MYTKLLVLTPYTIAWDVVRRASKSALSQLEKFEKLRSLCCMSEMEKKRIEAEAVLGPALKCSPDLDVPMKEPCEFQKPQELMDVKEKTVMVVGGAGGIGFETCQELIKNKAKRVIIVDNRQDAACAAVDKLNSSLDEPLVCPIMADIRSDCAFDMAFREALRCFCQVDIYINCVGIFDETPECWDQMVKLNLLGTIRGTILAYHYLSQNTRDDMPQGGAILNLSSYGAIANYPSMPIFSATANGINGLTSSFGQDFHYCNSCVRCVTLCMGCTTQGALKKLEKYHYRKEWAAHTLSALKCKEKQSNKDVARAIVHTIKFGHNGNIYVVMGGKYYRYLVPDYKKIQRTEAYLL